MKLNIGCGPNGQLPGFVNIDNSKAALLAQFPSVKRFLCLCHLISREKCEHNWESVRWIDASRKLPFPNESVDKIYTSHFLEHIPYPKGLRCLAECYRVLKRAGVLRIVLPDLLHYARNYVARTEDLLEADTLPKDPRVHDEFLRTLYGAYIDKTRYGLNHCYMYDIPAAVYALQRSGFQQIAVFSFGEGRDSELCRYDNRPQDSFHIECTK